MPLIKFDQSMPRLATKLVLAARCTPPLHLARAQHP
jgi:hypothetical protein